MLGALPVVDHFLDRLSMAKLLEEHLPGADGRVRLAPAKAIGVVVRNLALSHQPLYSMNDWATGHDPAFLGLEPDEVSLINDDRIGRALERLFEADRSSLLGRLVLDAVAGFGIDCSELHNDSTSITLHGAYTQATGATRGGRTTVAAARGHSKDHRPDLLQLVWILTVAADGAVPIAHRLESGNTEDSTTHIATWDSLCALLGRNDFLYAVSYTHLAVGGRAPLHLRRRRGRSAPRQPDGPLAPRRALARAAPPEGPRAPRQSSRWPIPALVPGRLRLPR